MRKVLCLLFCVALAGCASLSNPKALSTLSRVGVVAVSSNAEIGWYGEKQSVGLLGAAANAMANKGTKADADAAALLSRADALIDEAESVLLETLSGSSRVTVASRNEVTGSAAYAACKEASVSGTVTLKPQAYKFVDRKDVALAKGLKADAGLDAGIHAYFQFDKAMKSGVAKNGVMGPQVMLTVSVVDAAGKLIFTKGYVATGKEGIPVVAGVYDGKKLAEAFPAVIRAACESFVADLD